MYVYIKQLTLKEKSNTVDLAAWVHEYSSDMISWALYKVSDSELAKDLVQDTFLAASEKIENFRGDSAPKTWLYSILNFKIIDHYRAKVKKPVNVGGDTFSKFFSDGGEWIQSHKPHDWEEKETHLLDDDDFNKILKMCMDALPESWSLAIKLKFLLSKKGDEICEELGISPTNFWQIIHRAKLQLRECVDTNWFKEN